MSVTRTINWKRLETKQHKFVYIDIDGKEFVSPFIRHPNVSFIIHQIIYNTSYGLANLFNEPFSKDEIKSLYMDLLGRPTLKGFILFGVKYHLKCTNNFWVMCVDYPADWDNKCKRLGNVVFWC